MPRVHEDELEIDDALVRALVDSEFPHWAALPLERAGDGTVNVIYRLGDELSVRLPRRSEVDDTEVLFDGELLGKPENESEAEAMLELLAGKTHAVVSGLCLRTIAWEELHEETTLVTFRSLAPRELAHYVASHEWEGRAGGYAIQGLGASLVERIEGDFLNVVGLPGSLLVRVLATRFAGVYGFG